MTKRLEVARRNAARKAGIASKRADELTLAEQRAVERIAKAEQAVRDAEERLRKVKDKAAAIVAKRKARAAESADRAAEATERVKLAESKPVKATKPAGTLTAESGQNHAISKEAAQAVKAATGRKRSGTLSPDSPAALSLLTALDSGVSGDVGDTFAVALKGRKTALVFRVVSDGLAFNTVPAAVSIAA